MQLAITVVLISISAGLGTLAALYLVSLLSLSGIGAVMLTIVIAMALATGLFVASTIAARAMRLLK